MKVYIILDEPDEFGFRVFVKKVFSDKEKAIDYVYADLIKQPHYKCKCKQDAFTPKKVRVVYEDRYGKQDLIQDPHQLVKI